LSIHIDPMVIKPAWCFLVENIPKAKTIIT
jgi:hypothetical protein